MGRANSTARSLQIISRQQGWDPNEIMETRRSDSNMPEWPDYPSKKPFPAIESTFAREDIFVGDTYGGIPQSAGDTSEPCPQPSSQENPTFYTPTLRENEKTRTTDADPAPGKPGAE